MLERERIGKGHISRQNGVLQQQRLGVFVGFHCRVSLRLQPVLKQLRLEERKGDKLYQQTLFTAINHMGTHKRGMHKHTPTRTHRNEHIKTDTHLARSRKEASSQKLLARLEALIKI